MSDAGATGKRMEKINIKQYKGLVDSVISIKDTVENERARAKEKQQVLEERLRDQEKESSAIQRELSVQLRCAGRSYQSLLGATRELTEQLRAEEERRQTEIQVLEQQVKELKQQLSQAAKPWKEEVAKRDFKIVKLQENAMELEKKLYASQASILPMQEKLEAEIKTREAAKEVVLQEVAVLNERIQAERLRHDEEVEWIKQQNRAEIGLLHMKIQEIEAASKLIAGPYEKIIKELELKTQGLEQQLAQVDYKPYEWQVEMKEKGYDRLVRDFQMKQQNNAENVEKMRIGFEEVIAGLDKKIQESEKEMQRRLAPWPELVKKKEVEIERLEDIVRELKEAEVETRKQQKENEETLHRELKAAKGAVDILNAENTKLRRQIAKMEEDLEDPTAPRKMLRVELQLEDVVQKCQNTIKQRDRELKEKTEIISNLQKRLSEETRAQEKMDREWDRRVQVKEEGYGIVVAQLKYAEGQIVEERERTAAALREVAKRDEKIQQLKDEHNEELALRLADREVLDQRIRELEAEMDATVAKDEEVRLHWEAKYDFIRKRMDERVADLRLEMARRDRARERVDAELLAVRQQLERARILWEDKERELEVVIRNRDRTINGLKNEIEFINDSWDIKYNRLMNLFDKLQKKYDELLGPGGLAEALRRARDLKVENDSLVRNIVELKEIIKKQKRQVRDLQLDIDMHMKETADLISEKERGIAEMVGDYAKLQAQLRQEVELKEKLTKELTEEKRAIVASFQARIHQLEQLVESLRFTDRQELLDKIDVWRRAYERVCLERDELEDDFKEQMHMKDLQLRKMADENWEEKHNVIRERSKALDEMRELEVEWKKKVLEQVMQREEVEQQLSEMTLERDRVQRELARALLLADSRLIDPEKDAMRKTIQEQKEQMASIEAGIQRFIEDNTALRNENAELLAKIEASKEDWEPQIKWRDDRYEAMLREHEQLKQVLAMEMQKAQDTCKSIEEQVRKFPNPFEAEIIEMKEKYAQLQAGLQKLSLENIHLREKIQDMEEAHTEERDKLEESLRLAHHILQTVASLGVLKSMAKADLSRMEAALGIDLDGDGKVG